MRELSAILSFYINQTPAIISALFMDISFWISEVLLYTILIIAVNQILITFPPRFFWKTIPGSVSRPNLIRQMTISGPGWSVIQGKWPFQCVTISSNKAWPLLASVNEKWPPLTRDMLNHSGLFKICCKNVTSIYILTKELYCYVFRS